MASASAAANADSGASTAVAAGSDGTQLRAEEKKAAELVDHIVSAGREVPSAIVERAWKGIAIDILFIGARVQGIEVDSNFTSPLVCGGHTALRGCVQRLTVSASDDEVTISNIKTLLQHGADPRLQYAVLGNPQHQPDLCRLLKSDDFVAKVHRVGKTDTLQAVEQLFMGSKSS